MSPQPRTAPLYRLGANISFEPSGAGTRHLSGGWSEPDPAGFCWSDGPEAEILFAVATPARDVICNFDVMPFIAQGMIEQQQVEIFFNHFRVGYIEVREGRQTLPVYLPREVFMLRTAVINLHIPTARSPLELGLSADRRRLGLALWSLQMIPVQ